MTLDVASPSAAIGRQAAREAMLLGEAESMLRVFLSRVRDKALDGVLYPPQVSAFWAAGVEGMLEHLSTEEADYVREDFLGTDLPDDVYTAATTVLRAHAQAFGSVSANPSGLRTELGRVLSPDGFAVEQISASIGWLEQESTLSLVAAGFWDSLQETGSVWIKRIRRVTRTSATGMSGWISVTAIRLQDYPMKRWVTRHDDHVRFTHRKADGQTVPVNQPFRVGGTSLMYPGAKDAEYGEIVNCRCVLVGVK